MNDGTLVQVSSLLTLFRQALGDTDASGSGRWTNPTLLNFLDRGNKQVVGDVWFPDCRVIIPTVANQQLYRMPLMLRTDAIYVAGQLVVPTDLPTLEGRQLWNWDMRGDGSSPIPPGTGIPPGNDAPVGASAGGGNQAPLWTVQEPLSYPIGDANNTWATPKPDAQMWNEDQPPRVYRRGGWLGLVPAPANTVPVDINIDGVRQPDTINDVGQQITSPENFVDAIIWASVFWAKFADTSQRAESDMKTASGKYLEKKRILLRWRGMEEGAVRDGPKPAVMRKAYRGYHTRRYGGRGQW